ncbi:MAG: hypothetical protein HQ596_06235 [Candidatus Saganbacteria bacterium]|nr:hypothetical protein [Candidatus Saganbacteria bacterium]
MIEDKKRQIIEYKKPGLIAFAPGIGMGACEGGGADSCSTGNSNINACGIGSSAAADCDVGNSAGTCVATGGSADECDATGNSAGII